MIMTTLNGQTPDIAAQNITALKQLFPEIACEDKIDFDKLKQLLGDYVDDNKERYNFTWNGKGKALRLSQTPSMGTLRPCKTESKDWDTTQNLYIEGDNLEVLKLLQKSYHNKVKMIYIDPPYNTGGDFVYPDDFTDSIENYKKITGQVDGDNRWNSTNRDTSGRYHTDWLNMMYPRLRLARNLLRDDGVIFISIDDNEVDNLKRVCNEVFGEENFVATISVENNPKGRKNSQFVSVSSEYLVIYAKAKKESHFIENVPKKATDMTADENGNFVHNSGKRVLVGENNFNKPITDVLSDKNYSVYYCAAEKEIAFVKEDYGVCDNNFISQGYKKYCSYSNGGLIENTYSENKLYELFLDEALDFSLDKIYEKNYSDKTRIKSQLVNKEYKAIIKGKQQKYSMELTTTGAGTALKEMFNFNEEPFPSSKNVGLLKLIISLFENEPYTILDFFSGSATTAHAVMQLNAEDGGNRKFICVQLPEPTDEKSEAAKAGYKNICEIGKERIRRAGEKVCTDIQFPNEKENYKRIAHGVVGIRGINEDYRLENASVAQQSFIDDDKKHRIDEEFAKIDENNKYRFNSKLLDIGFKVFKLDSSNLKKWQPDYDNLEDSLFDSISNYVDGRSELDVVYEIIIKMGLDLTYPIDEKIIDGKKVYSVGFGALMMCLDDDITTDVAQGMVELHKAEKPETWKVVFKDNGFATDSVKMNVKEIFKCSGLEEDAFATV